MGHFHTRVRGIGRDKEDAQDIAEANFLDENGNRHSIRGIDSAKLLRKVPPKKEHKEIQYGITYIRLIDDLEAAPDKWLEEWEFVLHTHA